MLREEIGFEIAYPLFWKDNIKYLSVAAVYLY